MFLVGTAYFLESIALIVLLLLPIDCEYEPFLLSLIAMLAFTIALILFTCSNEHASG